MRACKPAQSRLPPPNDPRSPIISAWPIRNPASRSWKYWLGGVELDPLLEQGRVEDQADLDARPADPGEAAGPEQEVQPLDVGVGPDLGSFQFEMDGAAQSIVQLLDDLDGEQVMLPAGLDPLGPEEFQEGPEVAEHRAGLVVGDDLVPEGLLLVVRELGFHHDSFSVQRAPGVRQ